jgi:5-methylcytosine-specific restriction enzyme A
MPKKLKTHRPSGYKGPAVTKREAAQKQRKKPGWKWYNSTRWQKLRAITPADTPYCVRCEAEGIITPADTVNHKTPHKATMISFGIWRS